MRTFLIAFGAQFISYFLIVINTRAYTKGLYLWTAATDAVYLTQSFLIVRWIVTAKEARGWAAYLGLLTGGISGSLIAIWVTKLLYGG